MSCKQKKARRLFVVRYVDNQVATATRTRTIASKDNPIESNLIMEAAQRTAEMQTIN